MGSGMIGVVIFCLLTAIPLAIVGIVNGAKGIKGFKEAKRAANAKPVASLVLGIAGLAVCVMALIFSGTALIMISAIGAVVV